MQVAPALCQAYKGITASDLYMRYHEPGGKSRLELDLAVAAEMGDQIREATGESKVPAGRSMVARRNQRRSARKQAAREAISDGDALQRLKDAGIIPNKGGD